jgi:o-succinylbenzoate synthase
VIVEQARLHRYGGGAFDGVANARAAWRDREGLVVELVDREGRVGIGEATPLPGYSPDSLADARACIELALPRLLRGRLAKERAALAAAVDRAVLGAPDAPSARFALATALLDLASKQREDPLVALLSHGPTRASSVARSVLVGVVGEATSIERAAASVRRGAMALKLKARGDDPEAEARFVRALRGTIEAGVSIRLDLNGALDVDDARHALDVYAGAGVDDVEEPCRGSALLQLGPCAIPWLVDESLADAALREELLEARGCAGVVLKPTLLGLFECLELGREARARGLAVTVTHTFEGPIALAASCATALALAHAGAVAGLDRHPALAAFPRAAIGALDDESPPLAVVATSSPGLGITLLGTPSFEEVSRWTR